ncbi:MAG: DUF4430 domain-containing protein [Thermoplasmata archaeon]|nr:DUF4430 domain-containing protein [Thermoplasmata archaeon]
MNDADEVSKDAGQSAEKKPGPWPIIVAVIVISAAVGGIFIVNEIQNPDIVSNEITAVLIIDYGNGTSEQYEVTTQNNSVPGLLDEAIGNSSYIMKRSVEGVDYIHSIRGVFAQPPDNLSLANRSWGYYLNNTRAPGTADAFEARGNFTLVRDGQTVKLVFEEGYNPSGIFRGSGISVTVSIDYGNGTQKEMNVITENFTALGALESAVGYDNLTMTDYGAWGMLVDGIDGIVTGTPVEGIDDTSNYYWFWYVNGEFAYVGVSQYVLQDSDVIEWRFEESAW